MKIDKVVVLSLSVVVLWSNGTVTKYSGPDALGTACNLIFLSDSLRRAS